MTTSKLIRESFAMACALSSLAIGLRAQTQTPDTTPAATSTPSAAPAPAAPSAKPAEKVTTMEKYTVSDVPLEDQVLPTVRPVGDVMGDDRNIIDIPRSVSAVNTALMRDRNVKNAMDFGQFAPGVYSAAQYGIPSVPYIRGDLSQIYMGGQQVLFSRNSTPPSFNGVDAFNIVKGPGSAVYGPQTEGAGGYVDLLMKEPYFDAQHTNVSLTIGSWASGHSYSNPEATIDTGGPITDKLAYRVSYLSRYGEGYYLNDHDQTQDVYVAFTYLPTSKLSVEAWAQVYSDRTNEIAGVGRVTEDFIKNGNYIAGPAGPTTSGSTAYFGYDIITFPNPPPFTFGSVADGSYSIVNPATAHTVKLPPYDALINPSDVARAFVAQGQIKATLSLTQDSSLVNRLYFSTGHSNKTEEVGYSEYVPKDTSIEDRAEYRDKFRTWIFDNSIITGVDFKYLAMTSYQDYQTEPVGYYDLSQPLNLIAYPGYSYEGNTWGGGLRVPGTTGYSAAPGDIANVVATQYDTAVFFQDDIQLTKKLTLIPGYRADNIAAYGKSPPYEQYGYYNSYFTYIPLAAPVYIPAGGSSSTIKGYNNGRTVLDQSFFVSLAFKLNEQSSFYLTYDHVEALLGSSNFGGVDAVYLDQTLSTKSTLYEFGYKQSFLNNTLYFAADAFQQLKYGSQITGGKFPIKDNGLEFEAVYQPSKAWNLNANLTYQDATAFGVFYQSAGNYLDTFATTTPVDGKFGTGLGTPNFTLYFPPGGRMRAPGVPQFQANAFVQYTDPHGWGAGVGPQFIGKQFANDQDTLYIPAETELDGYVFFGTKMWDIRVNVKNIANARLLDPIDVSYAGNSLIYVRPPVSASITLRLHY
ncbi:MAG TPA: TonB-dependent receptor [Opitutaceae bacterium]|nr:TonB-dependent receptor [Opitutaceae bacterium]